MKKKLLCIFSVLAVLLSATPVFGGCIEQPLQQAAFAGSVGTASVLASADSDDTAVISDLPTRGKVEGYTYINEYFGIKVEFDENWQFASEEELASGMDAVTDENARNMIENGAIVNDVMASTTDYQDGTASQFLTQMSDFGPLAALMNLDPSAFYEEIIDGEEGESIKQQLTAQGIENVELHIEDTMFMGEDTPSIVVTGSINGYDVYERMIMLVNGRYGMNMISSSIGEDKTADVFLRVSKTADATASEEGDDSQKIAFSSDWIQNKCQIVDVEDAWALSDRIDYFVEGEVSEDYKFSDFTFKSSDPSVLGIELDNKNELVIYHPKAAGTADVTMTYTAPSGDTLSVTETITVFEKPDSTNGWTIEGSDRVTIPSKGDYEWDCNVTTEKEEEYADCALYIEDGLGVGCTNWNFNEGYLKSLTLHDFRGNGSGKVSLVLYQYKDDSNEVYHVAIKEISVFVK